MSFLTYLRKLLRSARYRRFIGGTIRVNRKRPRNPPGAWLLAGSLLITASAHAEKITVAVAADLKFAMGEIVSDFEKAHPTDRVEVVFGSSGKLYTQIREGAPYDLFFSADIALPRELAREGLTASEARPYALGHLVLWSSSLDASKMTLGSLADPKIARVAIANPKHAPYGKRAEEALRSSGLWEKIEPKLVYGENVVQAAQFVLSGNAQAGLIPLSLALSPELAGKGGYRRIPESLHQPLEHGFVITKRAEANSLARLFADYVGSPPARAVMTRYGFALPGEAAGK